MTGSSAKPEIHQFPCLKDNYGVLIRDPSSGVVAAIDAPNGDEVAAALKAKGWKLTHILTTHRHGDHTDGNLPLKAATGCTIIGPRAEAELVPGIDKGLAMSLRLRGVRTAEELAGLDEAAAKGLGMGIYTFGKAARNLLAAKKLEALEALQAEAPRRRRAEPEQPAA